MKKRLLSFFLSGLMVCFAFHSAVYAAAETIMNGEGETTDLTWELIESGSDPVSGTKYTLKIAVNTGGTTHITDMADYNETGHQPWNGKANKITKIVIEDGVTAIGKNAFHGLASLKEITIPSSVTSIGKKAFYECTNLASIDLTGVEEVGASAFSGCTNLASIDLTGVKWIDESAFKGCTKLTSIDLTGVKWIDGSAFSGCTNLATVTGTNSLTDLGECVFDACPNLKSLTIPCGCFNGGVVNENTTLNFAHNKLIDGEKLPTEESAFATCTTGGYVPYKICPQRWPEDEVEDDDEDEDEDESEDTTYPCGRVYINKEYLTLNSGTGGNPLVYTDWYQHAVDGCTPDLQIVTDDDNNPTYYYEVGITDGLVFVDEKYLTTYDKEAIANGTYNVNDEDKPYIGGIGGTYEEDGTVYYLARKVPKVDYLPNTIDKVNGKSATCTEDGYKEHYKCSCCGKLLVPIGDDETYEYDNDTHFDANENPYLVVDKDELIIPATGHAFGEWKVTKEATTTSEGEKTRTCGKCGTQETEPIAKLPAVVEEANSTSTIYSYAVDTGDYISGEAITYAYSLCVCGMTLVSLRKKKRKV